LPFVFGSSFISTSSAALAGAVGFVEVEASPLVATGFRAFETGFVAALEAGLAVVTT
jgi:hypothetical protein